MPGYALVLGAMLLAGLWFDRPSYAPRGAGRRALHPGLADRMAADVSDLAGVGAGARACRTGRPARRLALIAMLVASILAAAGIVQLLWEGHNGAVGLHDMLWTGKGVASGWAGLSWDKAWMMLSGVGNYFLIMGGCVDPLVAPSGRAVPLSVSVLLQPRSSWPPSPCCGRAAPTGGCAPSPSSFSARWARGRC